MVIPEFTVNALTISIEKLATNEQPSNIKMEILESQIEEI